MKNIFTFFISIVLLLTISQATFAQVQAGGNMVGKGINSFSGTSVSISDDGTIIAVGGDGHIKGVGDNAGYVQAYQLENNAWAPLGQAITGPVNSDLGHSISLSADGSMLAVGAFSIGDHRGQVQVYKLKNNTWTPFGQTIKGEVDGVGLGYALSLSADGTKLAVGVPGHSIDKKRNVGMVQVYKLVKGTWVKVGQNIEGEKEEDELGWSLALSDDGNTLGVGAPTNGSHHGHSAVYRLVKNTWVQLGKDIIGPEEDAQIGWSLSLSGDGNIVAIGIPFHDNKKGQVQTYEWNGKNWKQFGGDINGTAPGGFLGMAISLSAHGKVLAVGTPIYDNKKGRVQVFEKNGDVWDLSCEFVGATNGEGTGYGLALSEYGSSLVVGAPFYDEGRGEVKVYHELPTEDLQPEEGANFNENTYYRLTNLWQGDNRSFDVHPEGKYLNMAETGNYSGQFWKIQPLGDGYFRLTNQWQGEGRALDVINDDQNNQLIMAETGNYSGQYWKIEPAGEGLYRITNAWQADKSLDCDSDKKGPIAILAPIGNYSGQLWKITDTSKN